MYTVIKNIEFYNIITHPDAIRVKDATNRIICCVTQTEWDVLWLKGEFYYIDQNQEHAVMYEQWQNLSKVVVKHSASTYFQLSISRENNNDFNQTDLLVRGNHYMS